MHTDFLLNRNNDARRARPTLISMLLCLGMSIPIIGRSSSLFDLKQFSFRNLLLTLRILGVTDERMLGNLRRNDTFFVIPFSFVFVFEVPASSSSVTCFIRGSSVSEFGIFGIFLSLITKGLL